MSTEAEIKQLVESQGNIFIALRSEKYGKQMHLFVFYECVNGHPKRKTIAKLKLNQYCAECLIPTMEDCIALAATFYGECLSTEYVNNYTLMLWLCEHGHIFEMCYSSVQQGQWCMQCYLDNKCYTMDEIRQIAIDRGGVCLSQTYNSRQKLHLRCREGHEWYALLESIVGMGTWCSECSAHISERTCRKIFEFLYKLSFPKARPTWLKSENNTLLELDGFNSDINVAFEYDGQQHFKEVEYFTGTLLENQCRDRQKDAKCLEFGVTLYRIPYTVPYLQLYSHIRSILPANITQGSPETINYYTDLDLRGAQSQVLEEIKQFLREKYPNITLISTVYLNARAALELQCLAQHKIELSWRDIRRRISSLCSTCSHSEVKRKFAQDVIGKWSLKTGILLMGDYIGATEMANWCCVDCDKEFMDTWNTVKHSELACPGCRQRNKRQKTEN